MINLEWLNLNYQAINDITPIISLPKLTDLFFDENSISDADLNMLSQMYQIGVVS